MSDPSVPGALNVSPLTGNEIVAIATVGPQSAQTTTQDIANLASGSEPVQTGITAHSTGGQTSAWQLTNGINNVTTVAAANDSVKLPAATVGNVVTVMNNGANAMQVFGTSPDTINSIATATGVSQLSKTVETYTCVVAGNWIRKQVVQAFSTITATNPPTQRNYYGAVTLNFQGTVTIASGNGSVAGARGEIIGASGTTLKDGFYYGVQGKFTLGGATIDQTSAARFVGMIAQLDVSSGTMTGGQLSALWADMGATAAGAFAPETNIVRATNTTSQAVNAILYGYGLATYVMDLSANGGTNMSTTGTAGATATKGWLKCLVGGAIRYIPLADSVS
jgi:hypothetical protein